MPEDGTTLRETAALAQRLLEAYADPRNGSRNTSRHDAGPMVLAAVAASVGILPAELGRSVARRWVDDSPGQFHAVGSFGGLGGFLAGVRFGAIVDDELAAFAAVLAGEIPRWIEGVHWRTSEVAWHDYDLFFGPAGLVLAGAASASDTALVERAARHLARLCDDRWLTSLRAGTEIDPRSAFNVGRINTGMGHGVTGVASALRHAAQTLDEGDRYLPALRRACAWLVDEAYLADEGLITWPPVGRDGAPASGNADRRQAWCYGTPGVAWTLWDAGRVLGDDSLQILGKEAMRSFCLAFDPEQHLDIHKPDEELSVCHGAAGTLAVADTFARVADLPEAVRLRDFLDRYLHDRVERIEAIATTDMTILSGAGGIVAVMMAARGGSRVWLSQLALR